MLNRYIFILVAIIVIVGCRKEDKGEAKPISKYSYLDGSYSGIGTMILYHNRMDTRDIIYAPDAFDTFNIKYNNDSFIVVDGVTLMLDSASESSLTYSDDYWNHIYHTGHYIKISYDINKKSVKYRSGSGDAYGNQSYTVYTDKYLPNPQTAQYIASIQGVRNLSGLGFDTFNIYSTLTSSYIWEDSMYALNKTIDFFRVNDSTISFRGNPLDFHDTVMHYKLTDYASNTITFQTYHAIDYEVSTLSYNYATNKVTFVQHNFNDHRNRYLKIEQ